MMNRADHNGQEEPAGRMAITFGYQLKSVERHRFHMTVISVLRDCAVFASLKTRELLNFNHHQESSLISSSPLSDRLRMKTYWTSVVLPRRSGSLRRTSVPEMTPIVHVGRRYSHANQRGIPTRSAAMARTGASLRHKIKASTRVARRTMKPKDSQASSMAQTSLQMRLEKLELPAPFAHLTPCFAFGRAE